MKKTYRPYSSTSGDGPGGEEFHVETQQLGHAPMFGQELKKSKMEHGSRAKKWR